MEIYQWPLLIVTHTGIQFLQRITIYGNGKNIFSKRMRVEIRILLCKGFHHIENKRRSR